MSQTSAKGRTHEQPFGIQAPSSQYTSADYLSPQRLASIGWQFTLCAGLGVESFADIGAGGGLLAWLLRQNGKWVCTVDHNPGLRPSVVALLPQLPLADRAVDASLCCQVLEHLPFAMLETCLRELARICRHSVIISLPDATRGKRVGIETTVKRGVYWLAGALGRQMPQTPQIDPEHFWELGHDGLTVENIIDVAKRCSLRVVRHFRNDLNPYHYFFVFGRD